MCRRVFEEHVLFMIQHFALVAPPTQEQPIRAGGRQQVLLTFDDGFRNHAECVAPFLRRHGVPAMFFVPSRHATPRQYLWFAYLKMLEEYFPGNGFMFRGTFIDMSPWARHATVSALQEYLLGLTPHPSAMYEAIDQDLPRLEEFVDSADLGDRCAGMSAEQTQELAADPLFTVGAHTADHPLLTRCDSVEQVRQISENKLWIERLTGRRCEAIAYPGSEYDEAILQHCRSAGFTSGYGGESARGPDAAELAIPRIGVYYPSVAELGNKIRWSRSISYWRGGRGHAWQSHRPEASPAGSGNA
jgi:peptidoglycan/xylan/chitin deacetylase (PgdA/CDA1 family)